MLEIQKLPECQAYENPRTSVMKLYCPGAQACAKTMTKEHNTIPSLFALRILRNNGLPPERMKVCRKKMGIRT